MPVLSPGKHNSQPSLPLVLPLPILMIHRFPDSFPLHFPAFSVPDFWFYFSREGTRRNAKSGSKRRGLNDSTANDQKRTTNIFAYQQCFIFLRPCFNQERKKKIQVIGFSK
jgi:hypothetical protein